MSSAYRRTTLWLFILVAAPAAFQAVAGEKIWQIDPFWSGPRKPMVDLSYGVNSLRHRLFEGDLDGVGTIEVKLGFSRAWPEFGDVAHLSDRYLFFDYASSDLFGRALDRAKAKSEISRFGSGRRGGYAYDFTSSYLYPYTQTSLQWAKMNTGRPNGLSTTDAAILDRYEGSFRFSASAEAGVAFGFAQIVAIHAGYEVMAIYPRHVFWPWVGSYGIALVGMEAISHFGKDIIEASPALGPVLYTLLRGGLAYGYYMLVRDNQYWPFKSETPLTADGLRFGVTLTF
jgi:hypothetical protein